MDSRERGGTVSCTPWAQSGSTWSESVRLRRLIRYCCAGVAPDAPKVLPNLRLNLLAREVDHILVAVFQFPGSDLLLSRPFPLRFSSAPFLAAARRVTANAQLSS